MSLKQSIYEYHVSSIKVPNENVAIFVTGKKEIAVDSTRIVVIIRPDGNVL